MNHWANDEFEELTERALKFRGSASSLSSEGTETK